MGSGSGGNNEGQGNDEGQGDGEGQGQGEGEVLSEEELIPGLGPEFEIHIMAAFRRARLTLEVDGLDIIASIKGMIQAEWTIHRRDQRLIFRDADVGDTATLNELGIGPEAILHLVPRARGGGKRARGGGLSVTGKEERIDQLHADFNARLMSFRGAGSSVPQLVTTLGHIEMLQTSVVANPEKCVFDSMALLNMTKLKLLSAGMVSNNLDFKTQQLMRQLFAEDLAALNVVSQTIKAAEASIMSLGSLMVAFQYLSDAGISDTKSFSADVLALLIASAAAAGASAATAPAGDISM